MSMANGVTFGLNPSSIDPPTPSAIGPILSNGGTPLSPFRSVCVSIRSKISVFLEEKSGDENLKSVQEQTKRSLSIIQEALSRYPLQTLSLSYNGGKDCLLLLYLYLSLLADHPDLPDSLPAIYIPHHSPFPTLDAFVEASAQQYHLNVARYEHRSMREAFRNYLDDEKKRRSVGHRKTSQNGTISSPHIARNSNSDHGIQGIFVGTRRTDPHGSDLQDFSQTDGGWPPFVRILPVLEWKYQEVWAFLRHLNIPYCELYDLGYTSLGGTNDTHPNPALRLKEGGEYKPAWMLERDEEERLGREGGR